MIVQQSHNQRPPRSNRAIKTSQGTRTRPLLAPTTQNENQDDVLAFSDPQKFKMPKQNTASSNNQNYASSNGVNNLLPFQQRSFNGLLNDFTKKNMPRRISHKTRKNSGQITLFQHKTTTAGSSNVRQSRERKSKRSTNSNRSRSRSRSSQKSQISNGDFDTNTPTQKKSRRSLNFGKRARDHNAISAENMRFVAKLVNVKATVPHGVDMVRRDVHQQKLKKNLQFSSFQSANLANMMMHAPNQSNMMRSQQASPLSTHSKKSNQSGHKRQKSSPQVDNRLKSKGLHNFYKIQQEQDRTPEKAQKQSKSGTPKYLKPRAFDSKNLAQMYEADDHLLFGDKFRQSQKKKNKKCSDTASRGSSQRSSQGSVRRRKRKQVKRRLTVGDTGYDTTASGFVRNTMDIRSNPSNQAMVKNQASLMGQQQRVGVTDEPIQELHTGPKPNPVGQSLIQKMNHLMTQKQKRISKSKTKNNQNNSNIVEQVQHMLTQDQENYTSYGRDDLQSLNMRQAINEQPEDDDYNKQVIPKKSFVMKLSRSIPRQHIKRKSLQEAFISHPFTQVGNNNNNQKAALLSGYYNSNAAAQLRTTSKPAAAKKNRVTAGSLPPRNVKTATNRRVGPTVTTDPQSKYSFDYIQKCPKVSPTRYTNNAATHHTNYARTTVNASQVTTQAQAAAAKRRIIIAQNKQHHQAAGGGSSDDQQSCNFNNYTIPMARNTETGWNRQRRNLTTVENPSQNVQANAGGRPIRPDMPQSAHPATGPQKQGVKAMRQQINGQQPIRVYQQDMRKKFLTNKLFSPVLKSQASSSIVASQPFDYHTIGVESVGEPFNSTVDPEIQEVVFQGGLRPRVTRTADGGTRARINGHQDAKNYNMAGDYENGEDQNDILPQILPTSTMQQQVVMSEQSDQPPIPNQKWLATTSSFDNKSQQQYQKTPSSQSMSQIAPAKQVIQAKQLNMESADTFNHIISAQNIQEETQSALAAQEQINDGDQETQQQSVASLMNNIGLFTAPKEFNQISEEGGDDSEDDEVDTPTITGDKKNENAAASNGLILPPASEILTQNYPRLI